MKPRIAPVRVSLGTYRDGRGSYEAELVITAASLDHLIQTARKSLHGRATLAGGGIAVLTKRAKPEPAAEASPPSPPAASREQLALDLAAPEASR